MEKESHLKKSLNINYKIYFMKKYVAIIITLIVAVIHFSAQGQITRQQAIDKVLNEIVIADTGKINVYACTIMKHSYDTIMLINRLKIVTSFDSNWVFFIDDHPLSSWAHPCRLLFMNADDGNYLSFDQRLYPDSLSENFEIISQIELPAAVSYPADTTLKIPLVPKNSHYYAVLITGTERADFWYSTAMTYNTLLQSGYKKENIFLHYNDGNSNQGPYYNNFDGDNQINDINYPAYENDINNTFNAMAGIGSIPGIPEHGLGPEDILFIYVGDHGDRIQPGISIFYLADGEVITAPEFADLLKDIKCSQMIIVMQCCFSGGFGPELTDYINYNVQCKNRVVQTACAYDQVAYPEFYITRGKNMGYDQQADEFTYYWNAAVRGYYPSPSKPWESIAKIGSMDFSIYAFHYLHPLDYNPDTYDQLTNPFGNNDLTSQMSEAFSYADNFDTFSPPYPITGYGYFDLQDENYTLYTPQQWITSGLYIDPIPNTNSSCYVGDLNTLLGLAGRIDNSQTVENRSYVVGGNMIINSGASVTMDSGIFYMCPSIKLQIQPGGELLLDASRFTTDNYANETPEYWDGIDVIGDQLLSQIPASNQGKITLMNGAKIENANIGILASNRCPNCVPENNLNYSGGIIHCDSAYFVNNLVAMQFAPYTFTEHSYFTHSNFLTSISPLPNGEYPDYFIKLYGVSPISITGCSFKNTQEVFNNYTDRGNGILSSDSRFLISEYCLSNESPCIHKRQTVFQNLNKGIYATNAGSILSPEIINTFFYDNVKGLYLSGFTGISSPKVISNTFRVFRPGTNPPADHYGMYLDQCSGFHVEDNSFYTNGLTKVGIGLIVNNCGGEPNKIYRNTFNHLQYATLAQNINRDRINGIGLCYKCNTFSYNLLDIAITKDPGIFTTPNYGIAPRQGSDTPEQGDYINRAPAGNVFSSDTTGHFDILNTLNSFIYFYHYLPNPPVYKLIPYYPSVTNYTNSAVLNAVFVPGYGQEPQISCPSKIDNGGAPDLKEKIDESNNKTDSIEAILTTLIDGGSTGALSTEVQNSTPPEALPTRNELMSNSPYLSDSVMKVATGKEDVLDNAMIRDILVANPQSAKSDEIINLLEYRTTQMPDYMMDQILDGENSVGAKELLEARKAYWEGEHWFAYQNLINLYKGDSINPVNADSLVNLLESENSLISNYDLATWYYNNGNNTQAQNILNSIPVTFDLTQDQQAINQDYISFFNVKNQVVTDSSGIYFLTETQKNTLENIAINDPDMPGVFARNMLLASNNLQYEEPVFLPDSSLKSSKTGKYRGTKSYFDKEISYLKVFPNPAKDFFIAEYHLPTYAQSTILLIADESGKKLRYIPLNTIDDQRVIQTTGLTAGVYHVSLIINGEVKENSRIVLY